jgi:hypothetical protein
MDPSFWASAFKTAGPVLQAAVTKPQAPPQRADGYAMGGMLDARSAHDMTSGATGGAYGGAYSQSTVDGSNWTVSTGRSSAVGGGTSGGNGGLSPTLSTYQGGIVPAAMAEVPSGPSAVLSRGLAGGDLTLLALAVGAYFLIRR